MEINDTKIAIAGAIVMVGIYCVAAYATGASIDSGIVGMGITAIAGLAGYDMGSNRSTD